MRSIRPFLSALCLVLVLSLCGCSASPATHSAPSPLLVGYSQLGSESAFRLRNSQDMQDAAKRHGISLMFENANQKQEKQIEAIRSFIAYQVDSTMFEGLLPTIMTRLSLFERFYVIVNGVFDMTGIVYYLSIIVFFLFLSVQSLEKRRYN